MCTHPDDFLKDLVRELGNVKSNENELMAVSSTEINLTLNPKLAQVEGKHGHLLLSLFWY
jgi:Ras GTPase-activating-like protein IQGAP2/3